MTGPEQHADTVREHVPADYLGPDPDDIDGEKWGQHPEALAALDALVALAERADTLERRVAELEAERDYANGIASTNAAQAAALRSRIAELDAARDKALALLQGIDYEEGPRIDRAIDALAGDGGGA